MGSAAVRSPTSRNVRGQFGPVRPLPWAPERAWPVRPGQFGPCQFGLASSLRREVVAAEEAIIAATIDATEVLALQLDPASSHRLRIAVHSRLHPEVHPIPNDLALTRIELDAELAAGGPWNDDEVMIHARAKVLLAEGAERQAHQTNRMVAIVMNLRRAEGMQSIPLPALEAETLEQLESEREVLRSHATFTLDELLRLDQRLVNFPAIQRLRGGLIDQPDAGDAGESPERSDESQ